MGIFAHLFFYAIFTSALMERRFVGWVLLSRLRDSVSSRYEDVKVFKKIEEVSKLSGVSKRTLQYYDDEGILPVKRSKNNYRLYDDETMERLWKILWYKEMGLDLKEIKLILEGMKQETVIEEKVNKINYTIRVLEEQKKVIEYVQRYSIPVKSEENNKTFKDQIKQIRKEKGM